MLIYIHYDLFSKKEHNLYPTETNCVTKIHDPHVPELDQKM